MALYRLHKTEWEQQLRQSTEAWKAKTGKSKGIDAEDSKVDTGKRKRSEDGHEEEGAELRFSTKKRKERFPGGGRKGVSSGLSVVVRRNGEKGDELAERVLSVGKSTTSIATTRWWEEPAS